MTNPAIEAVRRYLLSQPLEQLTTDGARRVAVDLIAAVLDNLPREEMANALFDRDPHSADFDWEKLPPEWSARYEADADAAIAAARATLLPGDA